MNIYSKGALIAAFFGLSAVSAQGASIINGSFEDPDIASSVVVYSAGSTGITGWTVGSGSVDVVSTLWIAHDGDQAIDLDGSAVGSIFQEITGLVVGVDYVIDFFMSGNAAGGPTLKTMDVSVGATVSSYSFDTATGSAAAGDWAPNALGFTATSTSETLTFSSTTGGSFFGPAIDSVSISRLVAPVPLPLSLPLLLAGIGSLGILSRRKHAA